MKINKIVTVLLFGSLVFLKGFSSNAQEPVETYTILKGQTVHCLPLYTTQENITYTYTSSDTNVLTVAKDGTVTGVTDGIALVEVARTITSSGTNNGVSQVSNSTKEGDSKEFTQGNKNDEEDNSDSIPEDDNANSTIQQLNQEKTVVNKGAKSVMYALYKIQVVSLDILNTNTSIKPSAEFKLVSNITNTTSWSSSAQDVLEVDGSGKASALESGNANVTVTYANVSANKSFTVGNEASSTAEDIKWLKYKDSMTLGDIYKFTTNAKEPGLVKFTTSNASLAQVSESGKVKAIGVGTVTITAQYKGASITKTISIIGDNSKFYLSAEKTIIGVDEKTVLTGNRANITYKSKNSKIASVNKSTGVVTGVKKGTATIIATSGDETALLTIIVSDEATDLDFVLIDSSYTVGTSSTIMVNKENVIFTSSSPTIASIDTSTGILKALSTGTTTITATLGEETVTATISIVASISNEVITTLIVGDTVTLSTTTEGTTWSTSDASVATIDSVSGLLTAVGEGTCTIYAIGTNKVSSIELTVHASEYSSEQQKAASNANKYITTLLTEDGKTIKKITQENANDILIYLNKCKEYLDISRDCGLSNSEISSYPIYLSALSSYMSLKSATDGEEIITIAEAKTIALEEINAAILIAKSNEDNSSLKEQLDNILSLIEEAQHNYLINLDDISLLAEYNSLRVKAGMSEL